MFDCEWRKRFYVEEKGSPVCFLKGANVVNPKMHSTKGRKKHMENEVWPTVEVLPLGMIVLFTDPFWEVDPSGM